MFTADDLTRLAKACGAKPNAAVVQGIVDNQEWLEAGGVDTPGRKDFGDVVALHSGIEPLFPA